MNNIWETLGIEPTEDIKTIKEAFSKRSKEVHPEENPEEFQELKRAYNIALKIAKTNEEISTPLFKEGINKIEKKEIIKKKSIFDFETLEKTSIEKSSKRDFLLEDMSKLFKEYPAGNLKHARFLKKQEYIEYREEYDFAKRLIVLLGEHLDEELFCFTVNREYRRLEKKYPKEIKTNRDFRFRRNNYGKNKKQLFIDMIISVLFFILSLCAYSMTFLIPIEYGYLRLISYIIILVLWIIRLKKKR